MKKISSSELADSDMQEHYDFSKGARGKYARRYAKGSNLVLLAPDVAKAFPTSEAVNESLRALAGIITRHKTPVVTKLATARLHSSSSS